MLDFYSAYVSGRDAMVTVFSVYMDGNIGALTFIHRNGKIQSFYVSVGWREGGMPEIKGFGSNDLEEIRLTEKGYFIYTNTETIAHGNLREYYRVKPLSDECRELTKKYIYGLSFVNYNMLVTNWDASNVEEILMPCMFEDIYPIYTDEPFKTEGGLIPAEIYERVMTTCFPVSVEQVREHCGYRADVDSYEYEMIFARQFSAFWGSGRLQTGCGWDNHTLCGRSLDRLQFRLRFHKSDCSPAIPGWNIPVSVEHNRTKGTGTAAGRKMKGWAINTG